jgi:hypothetical protein
MPQRKLLRNVTGIIIDDVSEKLGLFALEKIKEQVAFKEFVWFRGVGSLENYQRILWNDAWRNCLTSHMLIFQYDGWILDGSLWDDSWLEYDYIGAPWPWHKNDGLNVGNGGFSLRSKRLMKYLGTNSKYPLVSPEDETICRTYRPDLELDGFRFAPESVARNFSFEREAPRKTFGFHGIFNVPKVLDPDELQLWMSLANDYVKSKVEWKGLPS